MHGNISVWICNSNWPGFTGVDLIIPESPELLLVFIIMVVSTSSAIQSSSPVRLTEIPVTLKLWRTTSGVTESQALTIHSHSSALLGGRLRPDFVNRIAPLVYNISLHYNNLLRVRSLNIINVLCHYFNSIYYLSTEYRPTYKLYNIYLSIF